LPYYLLLGLRLWIKRQLFLRAELTIVDWGEFLLSGSDGRHGSTKAKLQTGIIECRMTQLRHMDPQQMDDRCQRRKILAVVKKGPKENDQEENNHC